MKLSRYLILIALAVSGCIKDEVSDQQEIHVVNRSNRRISFCDNESFPDTSLAKTFSSGCGLIDANADCYAKPRLGWDLDFTRNQFGVINFYVSDYDTIVKYGGDRWRSDYLILKRYSLTRDSMIKMNWTITYP